MGVSGRIWLTLPVTAKGEADIIAHCPPGPGGDWLAAWPTVTVGTAKAISAGFWEATLWRADPAMGPQGTDGRGPMAYLKSGLKALLEKSIAEEGPWWA